jgi:hypothetical protein
MSLHDLAQQRLCAQAISCHSRITPYEAVSRLAAVQAQDRSSSLWAVGLRVPSSSARGIEEAVRSREIVRTWLMRGTLHFVAAEDIHWMLRLLGPRTMSRAKGREGQLLLDDRTFACSEAVLTDALRGGGQLTRKEAMDALEGAKISTAGGRGYRLLWHLALTGLICFGPMKVKEPTFVLLDEWVTPSKRLTPQDSMAELAWRYFKGHGPAKVEDFAWWSGLPTTAARDAIATLGSLLIGETLDGEKFWSGDLPADDDEDTDVHLLPAFDEYIIGYRDRRAVLDQYHHKDVLSSNGIFYPTMVIDGRIRGTWRAVRRRKEMIIEPRPFSPLNKAEERFMESAARRYGDFNGLPTKLV